MNKEPKAVRTIHSYNMLLLDAVDESLSSLGEDAKCKLYYVLEYKFGLSQFEIVLRTDEFYDALERVLGKGAQPLRKMCLNRIGRKLGRTCIVVPLADFSYAHAIHRKNARAKT